MTLLKILFLSLLVPDVLAKCTICSVFADYYEDIEAQERSNPKDSSESLKARVRSYDATEAALLGSLGRFTDLTSTLFGSLMGLVGDRVSRVSSSDIPDQLNGRVRTTVLTPKKISDPKHVVTDQLFNIFDTIGSGIMQVSRLEGPHICIRESTKKSPADGEMMKSEKICQRFRNARKCIDSKTESKMTIETTRVEECCEGYDTRDIFRYGCPLELESLPMEEVLTQLNSSLWSLAKKAKVSDKLKSDDITVIISPDNEDKYEDPKSYVLNRIVPRKYRSYEWVNGDVLRTAAGGELLVSQTEDAFGSIKTYVNCLPLDPVSYSSDNGIVYLVTGDLQPVAETVLSALTNDARLTTFTSLLSDDLREKLSSNESFTVFAPSDKAFSSLSGSLLKDIKGGIGCAADFARSHIIDGSFCSHQLYDHPLKSLAGSELEARTHTKGNERVIHVGRARVMVSNILAKNGVIFIIDDVVFNDELLSWREHLEAHNSNLREALEDVVTNPNEKLTIFVPPTENSTISTEFAKNHIVIGESREDFKRPSTVTTQANSTIFTGYSRKTSPIWVRISMQPGQRQRGQVGCSRIIEDSVKGCNAVLQFIEKPLPLVTDNFDTFLAKRSDLSKFYRLWQQSSLNGSMTDEKLLTAFIPSDDAFSNNEFKKLVGNRKLTDIFVRRYLVDEPLCEFDIRRSPGEIRIQTYANLNGEALRPTTTDGDTYIDGARVEDSEIMLSNGVAYVLDATIAKNYISTQPGNDRRRPTNALNIIP
uniref:FAS1 domain-containing protein n=1 Tax=Haemonchus contortus TaxID=6289 RepID=A0A7I4Y7S3_HAECO